MLLDLRSMVEAPGVIETVLGGGGRVIFRVVEARRSRPDDFLTLYAARGLTPAALAALIAAEEDGSQGYSE